jgi:hypothetical protein
MDWWIGLCGAAGIILALTLDYRAPKRNDGPWLSGRPLERAVLVSAAGAFVGLTLAILPIQLYRICTAFMALYSDPPKPFILVALLPMTVGVAVGVWIMRAAGRALLRWRDQRQGAVTGHQVWSLALASGFWLLATLSIGGGFFTSFLLMRGP